MGIFFSLAARILSEWLGNCGGDALALYVLSAHLEHGVEPTVNSEEGVFNISVTRDAIRRAIPYAAK